MNIRLTDHAGVLMIVESALLAVMTLALIRMGESNESFRDAAGNQLICEQLAEEIRSLQELDTVANEQQASPDLGNAALLRLASEVQISEGQVTSIQRLAPMAIEETEYERQDVVVQLRDVTMEQLVRFALAAENEHRSSKVTSLHLQSRPSRNSSRPAGQEAWSAEVILTQLIYAARSAPR